MTKKLQKVYIFLFNVVKNNYKLIIFYIILILLFTIRLDYEIYTPGGLINLDKKVEVENSYKSSGSINMTYVGGKKGIIPFILLSYVIPSWDLINMDDLRIDTEDYQEIVERNLTYLDVTNQNAVLVAYDHANISYEIKNTKVSIIHIYNYANTNLKTGDVILSIENNKINELEDIMFLNNLSVGSKLNIKVMRDKKEINAYAIIQEVDGKRVIGMNITESKEVIGSPKVKLKFKKNEMGPSGGLMTSLAIYDELVKTDITKGDIISGTGTINSDGSVGEISGIKYKLAGAVKKKANIFLCPTNNYEEALNEKKKNNYNIDIKSVDTFDTALDYLLNR